MLLNILGTIGFYLYLLLSLGCCITLIIALVLELKDRFKKPIKIQSNFNNQAAWQPYGPNAKYR